jgi:hypothetical protein
MRKIDLVGQQFGRLQVTALAPRTYQTMWHCRCECGNTTIVSGINMRSGHTTSCGCYGNAVRADNARRRDYTGSKNPRAKTSLAKSNGAYVPSSSVWYARASGIYYSARRKKVAVGFPNVAALAAHVMAIAPARCPVFDVPFVERGAGFSKWSPSIDKIDPAKGYVPGNIQVVSLFANCMKRDATKEQLRAFARWVRKEFK